MVRVRSPASVRPNARMKRPICSRSWCAPALAPTTSTTARGFATPRRSRRCSKASARPRCRRLSTKCKNSDVIIVIGANPTENHPVAATFFKQAAKRGAKLIVMDPRGQALKRHAWRMLQFKNGADVAMLNAILNVIVTENLARQAIRADLCRRFCSLRGEHQGLHAGRDGADLRHSRRHIARSGA